MLRPLPLALAATVITLAAAGCEITSPDLDEVGRVTFVDVEGGCWAIDTSIDRVQPLNLPQRFKVDGLRVRFRANRVTDMASICQIGPLVQLESIEAIG